MFAAGKTNAVSSGVTYVDDVFSTYLYTGNGSTQTITNGIDLSGKGGMVWTKQRSGTTSPRVEDTVRGIDKALETSSTAAASSGIAGITSFSSSGYAISADSGYNLNGSIYTSWTFRKQPKFFDVVTYTGNGAGSRSISHSLGTKPGWIIVKRTDTTSNWFHFAWNGIDGVGGYTARSLSINSTNAAGITTSNGTNPHTTTTFDTGEISDITGTNPNVNGGTYVAYLFAHNAGGFGLSGTDNVISCGSFTTDGSGNATVTLGYEPQWCMFKRAVGGTGNWTILDNMRGWPVGSNDSQLQANSSGAETSASNLSDPNATGFSVSGISTSSTYIYIAIRRGPMKTPTDATKVFTPTVYTGTNVDNRLVDTTIAPDMVWVRQRDDTVLGGMVVGDRLRGQPYLLTGTTAAEVDDADAFDQQIVSTTEYGTAFSAMNGFWCGNDATAKLNINTTSNNHIAEAFKRAPGFFDVVCYTGTGANRTVDHNLGVVPELMIVKRRGTTGAWAVYSAAISNTEYLVLNTNAAKATGTTYWNSTTPTSSVFSLGTAADVNASTASNTYVAYLFATVAGVSKVGSYTGTGTTLQVDCGFTGGARFVRIKRTDSTGDWYVWDSARGIVAGNDPYLLLNSTAAEVTTTDYVDAYSAGFEISSTAPAEINANGGTFLFLAIA